MPNFTALIADNHVFVSPPHRLITTPLTTVEPWPELGPAGIQWQPRQRHRFQLCADPRNVEIEDQTHLLTVIEYQLAHGGQDVAAELISELNSYAELIRQLPPNEQWLKVPIAAWPAIKQHLQGHRIEEVSLLSAPCKIDFTGVENSHWTAPQAQLAQYLSRNSRGFGRMLGKGGAELTLWLAKLLRIKHFPVILCNTRKELNFLKQIAAATIPGIVEEWRLVEEMELGKIYLATVENLERFQIVTPYSLIVYGAQDIVCRRLFQRMAREVRNDHRYGIVTTATSLHPGIDGQLQDHFGSEFTSLLIEPAAPTNLTVHQYPFDHPNPSENLNAFELKKSLVWQNPARNRKIAELARFCSLSNTSPEARAFWAIPDALTRSGCHAETWNTLIVAENRCQADALQQFLPHFEILSKDTVPTSGQLPLDRQPSVLGATGQIVTAGALPLLRLHRTDLLVVADPVIQVIADPRRPQVQIGSLPMLVVRDRGISMIEHSQAKRIRNWLDAD